VTANPLYTTPAPDAARDYTQHVARRAGVLEWRCTSCSKPFDVGYERLIHPSFRPLCFDCATKETP
jgi:hypothetical protein